MLVDVEFGWKGFSCFFCSNKQQKIRLMMKSCLINNSHRRVAASEEIADRRGSLH